MLPDVVAVLACPHCTQSLEQVGPALRCPAGHSFDLARQGYVALLTGGGQAATGDSAAMVAARARFLDAGHYQPIMDAVAGEVARVQQRHPGGCVLDVGAGTGHYLAAALEQAPAACGVAVDASKAAAKVAARAHPRAGSVLADAWRQLPVADAAVSVALTVFAPRSAGELHRALTDDGSLVVVTPTPNHLAELVGPLGLLHVDERKPERLEQAMQGYFARRRHTMLEFTMTLRHQDVQDLVGMGPSAFHTSVAELAERVAGLEDPLTVTASTVVSVYQPLVRVGSAAPQHG
ncbi:putative RNA methyltransferase [Rhodococcus sp. X156]|uniref:putative RNA methyltransferase n=1 Tax=Rhodococcus sp. X156 TaxID=2499145 RepID=UPI000FDB01A0|nr:methyltransferase domain-containing protein [Rhodococcus sp. X156]